MSKPQKEHRYSDRQRSFDEDLEETMSSFSGGTETNDTPVATPAAEKTSSEEHSALDRLVCTASDEVAAIADAPVDSVKVAEDLRNVELRDKLQKMAAARPAFVQEFLDGAEKAEEKTAVSADWIANKLVSGSKGVPLAPKGALGKMQAKAALRMAEATGGKKSRNELARGGVQLVRTLKGG